MATVTLQVSPLSDELWVQYQKLAQDAQYPAPLGGPRFIFITDAASGVLVAGLTVIDTSGPFILFEDLLVNPAYPARVRHRAVEYVAELVVQESTLAGKIAVCCVTFQGGATLLGRLGFEERDVRVMVRGPGALPLETVDERGKPAPEPPKSEVRAVRLRRIGV